MNATNRYVAQKRFSIDYIFFPNEVRSVVSSFSLHENVSIYICIEHRTSSAPNAITSSFVNNKWKIFISIYTDLLGGVYLVFVDWSPRLRNRCKMCAFPKATNRGNINVRLSAICGHTATHNVIHRWYWFTGPDGVRKTFYVKRLCVYCVKDCCNWVGNQGVM